MLQPDVSTKTFAQFNGAVLRLDPYTVDSTHGFYSQNVSYVRGEVGTRFGHSTVFTQTDGAITTLYNWYFTFLGSQAGIVIYYAPAIGIKGWQQGGGGFTTTLMAVTGAAGAVPVATGLRLYSSFYDATGRLASASARVYGHNIGDDLLFAAPLTSAVAVSETSTGVVTAGTRRIAFLPTTRNGFTTKLSPVDSGTVFAPGTFTSTGGKNLHLSISGALPSYMVGGTIQAVMTTTANLNRYFTVPGATTIAGNPTTLDFSISDNDLAATGTDVTSQMNLFTNLVGNVVQVNPSAIFTYSSRMCYIAIDLAGFPVIYISEPNNFQYITADQHAVYLEGLAQAVVGFSLRGVCYIGTQFSFFSTEDNGGVPATWTPPQKVDGSIGILSPTCITVNPSLGYAAIASDRGLYIFQGGIFPALPISYYQASDWGRINWAVPTTVKVVDDQLNKRFIVLAPLSNSVASVSGTGPYTVTTTINPHLYQTGLMAKISGVTGTTTITVTGPGTFTIPGGAGTPTVGGSILPQTASHELTWDYTEGDTPESVKYSLNSFTSYNAGAVAVIQNISSYLNEVWYAPFSNGVVARQNDGTEANPYRDVATDGTPAAINSFPGYQTSLIPGSEDPTQTIHDAHGAHFRVRGNGNLKIQAIGLDGVRTVTPVASPIALQTNPGQEILAKWFLRSEQSSIQLGTNALDAFFILSLARCYYTNAFAQR